MVTFRAEDHTYWSEGRRVPSVTEIIGANVPQFYAKGSGAAMERGSAVHAATELWDTFGADDGRPEIQPFLIGWKNFLIHTGSKVLLCEKVVSFHAPDRTIYAGTLDRLVERNGRNVLVDIKTGSAAAWHVLQLAAYAQAVGQQEGFKIDYVMAVYLRDTGSYTTKAWDAVGDNDAAYRRASVEFGKYAMAYKADK
jgi:ATP-dependent exoDNAse (exonuclease V) beta subunit